MNTTVNYGLKKPAETDFVDESYQNDNMDVIDGRMKSNAETATAAQQKADQLQSGVLQAGDAVKVGGKKVTVSVTAPSSPSEGDIWIDTSE